MDATTLLPEATMRAAAALIEALAARGLTLATAESCTGGLIAAAITAIPGSSAVAYGGWVTYANTAKTALLGVDPALLERVGAVSAAVAREMATGALTRSGAGVAIACTGVAGPGGGSAAKPVGLVYLGCAGPGGLVTAQRHVFPGDRAAIRAATVAAAFALVTEALAA